jgi:hypothetical protein
MIGRFAIVAFAMFSFVGMSTAVRADEATSEVVWKRYWMAIEVQKICHNTGFSQSQYDNMVHLINQRINYDLGAGVRHQLMNDAKTDAFDLTFKYGCSSPDSQNYLALYNSDLAPVAGQ